MKNPTFINFRGYTTPDPLDKAPGFMKYFLLMVVNIILSIILIYLITENRIVYFQGFTFFGKTFSSIYTEVLEVIINGFIFSSLIVVFRKSSSLIPFLIVLLPYYLMDLFIESHYRCATCNKSLALWMYYGDSVVSHIKILALKFFVTLSVDAIIFGIIGLYLARLLAAILYKRKPYPARPTKKQFNNLFRDEWTHEKISRPKRDIAFYILRILGFSYLIYLCILILGLLGSEAWPPAVKNLIDMTYKNPALAINTYFKITLMIMLTFIAAYNKQLRFYACLALLTGHAASTIYSLVFYFWKSIHATEADFLLTSAEADGVMIIVFLWIMLRFKKDGKVFAPENDFPINFSVPMTITQSLHKIMGIIFLFITIAVLLFRIFASGNSGLGAVYGNPDPMIGNTVTLYCTLSLITFMLVRRERLRQYFFNPLIVPLTFGSFVAILWIIIGDMRHGVRIHTRNDTIASVDWYFVLFALFNVVIAALLIGFRRMYYKVDYSINTLSPSAAIDAIALTKAFYNGDDKQHAAVLKSIDQYAGGIRGRRRGLLNLPFSLFENFLNFFYGLHPPFSTMSTEEQRYFLSKYFLRNEMERRSAMIPLLADFANQIGLSLNSIIMFGNYSYLNVKDEIGYVPVDARDRTQGNIAAYRPPHKCVAPLPVDQNDPANFKPVDSNNKLVAPRVTTPIREQEIPDEIDFLIIGSGAGGATAAYRLASSGKVDPEKILVIERGNRYQPLQDFQDSEIEMMKKVYKEGGLQQTKTFTMTLLQGECVGGTTVVNNAVCFEMPENIRKIWRDDYDINLSELDNEYRLIENELSIQPLGPLGVNEIVEKKFRAAVGAYNASCPPAEKLITENSAVKVNHLNNVGDGNWNLGNKRMRKRSMLETYIPWSESKGVKVVANMTAVRFTSSPGNRRADYVILRADNGALKKIKINKAVIVAGGVIASSHFLMRSEIKNNNIGKNLSCNFAFPVAFDFNEEIRAYDGDQITLAALDPLSRSAFETYFNPPASFALSSVPFFFNRRDNVMSRYKYMLNFGSLIGSESNGVILKKADLLNGQAFTWEFGEKDVSNIKYAMTTLVQLGKLAGSTRAIIPTKPGIELELSDANVEAFRKSFYEYPLRMEDMFIGSAHPQGGNMMAGDNSRFRNIRVLGADFRLDGYDNVFVADASLFPTSVTINPQWTIMAMSSLAVKNVLNQL